MHAIEGDLKGRNFMLSHKTNHKMFVFQDNSCFHEARGGQVPRKGAGPISMKKVGSWCVFNR